jgi:hypothetical protein
MSYNVFLERLKAHNAGKNVKLVPERGTVMHSILKEEMAAHKHKKAPAPVAMKRIVKNA